VLLLAASSDSGIELIEVVATAKAPTYKSGKLLGSMAMNGDHFDEM
jgi:hypothetical protein